MGSDEQILRKFSRRRRLEEISDGDLTLRIVQLGEDFTTFYDTTHPEIQQILREIIGDLDPEFLGALATGMPGMVNEAINGSGVADEVYNVLRLIEKSTEPFPDSIKELWDDDVIDKSDLDKLKDYLNPASDSSPPLGEGEWITCVVLAILGACLITGIIWGMCIKKGGKKIPFLGAMASSPLIGRSP